MHRYIRQKNNYTCGPIALYNLLTWANAHDLLSYRNIYKLTECNPIHGTTTNNFSETLKRLIHESSSNLKLSKCKIIGLQKLLLANTEVCAIVEYEHNENYLHFVLMFANKQGQLFIVNQDSTNIKKSIVKEIQNLDFMNKFNNKKQHPMVWTIFKK